MPVVSFQSTRPRGARRPLGYLGWAKQRFNPRARAGRDLVGTRLIHPVDVSIHAPARGATRVSSA